MKQSAASRSAGYASWCHLEVLHEYFDGKGCAGAELALTAETQRLITRMGLLMRREGPRLSFFLPPARRSKAWQESFSTAVLTFHLLSRAPEFHLYTALPRKEGKILYFTTRTARGTEAERLTVGALVSERDLRPLAACAFSAPPKDLSVLGVVSLVGGNVPTRAKSPTYTITFPARSAVWRYDIFAEGQATAKLKIRERSSARSGRRSSAPITFRRLKAADGIPDPSGQISVAFESSAARPIPMRARPGHLFELVRGESLVVIDTLPTPTPSLYRRAHGDGFCSRMFVRL